MEYRVLKVEDQRLVIPKGSTIGCTDCGTDLVYRGGSLVQRCDACRPAHLRMRRYERYWQSVDANRADARQWNALNVERKRKNGREYYRDRYAEKRLEREFGLTGADWRAMAAVQGHVCAICDQPPSGKGAQAVLNVDHDHTTGKVRQLLCGDCNRLLGCAKDDIGILQAAILYLEKHGN